MDIKLLRAMVAAGATDEEITAVAMLGVKNMPEQTKQEEPTQEPEQPKQEEPKQEPDVKQVNMVDYITRIDKRFDELTQKIINANMLNAGMKTEETTDPVDILATIINPTYKKKE